MSDVQTSPAPAEAAAPVADGGAVESPASSGELTEQSVEDLSSAPEGEPTTEVSDETPDPWDHTTWDGNLDNLPGHLQDPVRFLHKQLEGGYTKKFQSLSDERKAFDDERSQWQDENNSWKTDKSKLEAELDILRALYSGQEDPRIAEFQDTNDQLTRDLAELQGTHEAFQAHIKKDAEEQAREYANQFRKQHSDIFESEEKRGVLSNLMDGGWSPDDAVKLINADKKVVELANELKGKGVPPEVAVEHALLKAGSTTPRAPRPGATLTSGARSQNNPASGSRSGIGSANPRDARLIAARAAMNWQAKTKL